MESFFSRYKNALVLIVVLVAQLLALAIQVKRPAADSADQQGVSLIRYVVVSVVTPPERWLHYLGRGIRGVWSGYVDLIHVRQDDANLKLEIERMRLEQASLAADAEQGQRLQQLLGFRQHYVYKTLPAQVIGVSGTEQSGTLFIDKGAKEGLAVDMPVVTADGIVGKLKNVFDHKSQVLLISDRTSGVGVTMESTRTRGILKGGSFGELRVMNVSPDERIKQGERIVTSGGDQIFPRGMPVGTVDRVVPDPDRDPWVDIVIHPAANLSALEEVLVITNVGDTVSPQASKDLAESEAEGAAEQKRASDVLSERLPARLDAKAPADTNPDTNADNTGENVRLMTPPKPLRPDQYSPEATPPSTELTPGQRHAPVLQGTEDTVAAPPQRKPPAAVPAVAAEGDDDEAAVPVKKVAPGTTVKAGTTANGAASASGGAANTGTAVARPSKSTNGTSGTGTSAEDGDARSVKTTNGIATRTGTGTGAGTAGSGLGYTSSSSSSGTGDGVRTQPKTHIVEDGPISAPVRKKAPEIVPDDGSRPPSTQKPAVQKPKPAVQPVSPPPNGGR
jgi:rod shape-determining protein MreC